MLVDFTHGIQGYVTSPVVVIRLQQRSEATLNDLDKLIHWDQLKFICVSKWGLRLHIVVSGKANIGSNNGF